MNGCHSLLIEGSTSSDQPCINLEPYYGRVHFNHRMRADLFVARFWGQHNGELPGSLETLYDRYSNGIQFVETPVWFGLRRTERRGEKQQVPRAFQEAIELSQALLQPLSIWAILPPDKVWAHICNKPSSRFCGGFSVVECEGHHRCSRSKKVTRSHIEMGRWTGTATPKEPCVNLFGAVESREIQHATYS